MRVDSRVEMIDADGVLVNGERIGAATVLWAAGVVASPAAAWLGQEPTRRGASGRAGPVRPRPARRVRDRRHRARALAWHGGPAPGLAPAAKQGGDYVASVLRARLRGTTPPFRSGTGTGEPGHDRPQERGRRFRQREAHRRLGMVAVGAAISCSWLGCATGFR